MKYQSTKFQLAVFFAIIISIALFVGKLSGSEFNFAMSAVLSVFTAANVVQKKVLNDNSNNR